MLFCDRVWQVAGKREQEGASSADGKQRSRKGDNAEDVHEQDPQDPNDNIFLMTVHTTSLQFSSCS